MSIKIVLVSQYILKYKSRLRPLTSINPLAIHSQGEAELSTI